MTTVRVLSDREEDYVALLEAAGIEVAPDASVVLADPGRLTAADLKGVTWVQSTWAGVDAIDWTSVPPATVVTGLPGVFGAQMAEFVFAYLLGHAQRVPRRFATRTWDETTPSLLRGSTLGILGAGSIGGAIAEAGAVFGMEVVGCRRSGAPDPRYSRMHPISEVAEFAAGLDHLVAVLPATPETEGLIDRSLLDLLAAGAVFVNVGRGSTAVTDDVIDAVADGRIALAVLDVTDPEPLADDHRAWSEPRVVVTGHTAAHSRPVDIVEFFGENLGRFVRGEPLVGIIGRERGY